jgi:hypothetical protein
MAMLRSRWFHASGALALVMLIGCSSSEPSTSPVGQGGTGGQGGAGGQGQGGTSGQGGAAPFEAAECAMAGGVCVPAGRCAPEGGAVAPVGVGGCQFDDGPAECCVPPAPQPSGTSCRDFGGVCAPIGGCLAAGGYFTPEEGDCGPNPSSSCCVAHSRCADQTPIDCCQDGATFRPACDDGRLVCVVGEPRPVGACEMP